ncbi:protein SSUH2 [Artemisia annua]|uniref:Protein SSUH2 n=1 Tax=Artemisia annua TaxID=35608 RepID=A0A2U1MUW3_ARTAN|nr:protein SSUH2 [Artemisia annua]
MRGRGGGVGGGGAFRSAYCAGREDIVCATYNAAQEPRFYKQGQMTRSTSCYGRTLIAHRDGSDTICVTFYIPKEVGCHRYTKLIFGYVTNQEYTCLADSSIGGPATYVIVLHRPPQVFLPTLL